MRALCPTCGMHHEIVRVLDDGQSEAGRDVYQVAPLESCSRAWISDGDLLDARAKFGHDPIVEDGDETDLG